MQPTRQFLFSVTAGLSMCAAAIVCPGSSASERGWALSSSATSPTSTLVTLGDSVPRGTHCRCTPYPRLVADSLTTTGRAVSDINDSVAGYTTGNVLEQLAGNRQVIAHVRGANAVEIEIGANDIGYTRSCGTKVGCYVGRVPAMDRRLAAIVARVHALTAGRRVRVLLLDYWSIWLGGKYAAAHGRAYVAAAKKLTDRVDTAIRTIATRSGSAYVDLRAAFKGPSYAYDETHYLSDDGDHPNAAGHRRIATAVEAAIGRAL